MPAGINMTISFVLCNKCATYVSVSECDSREVPVTSGVPQGRMLGTLLFLV